MEGCSPIYAASDHTHNHHINPANSLAQAGKLANNLSSTSTTNNNNNSPNSTPANPSATTTATMVETKKIFGEQTDSELAELATQEISLDLQGLIDDTQFPDDNLFGDLMETAKKNDAAAAQWMSMARGATPSSSGSSGQNSPGSEGQNSPPAYIGGPAAYAAAAGRNTLAYLPGSVHAAGFNQIQHHVNHHHHNNQNIQVKQEPQEQQEFASSCSQVAGGGGGGSVGYASYGQGAATVSSTTHSSPEQHHGHASPASSSTSPLLPFSMGGPLPTLKSFSQHPKYLVQKKKAGNGGDKNGDDYRRRRERNNVAVRKSREKAKVRTRETEERVKILARENDRLQKKVELLQEELGVLRSLFSSVGVLPDHVHRELAKHLDNFQAQHAAINY